MRNSRAPENLEVTPGHDRTGFVGLSTHVERLIEARGLMDPRGSTRDRDLRFESTVLGDRLGDSGKPCRRGWQQVEADERVEEREFVRLEGSLRPVLHGLVEEAAIQGGEIAGGTWRGSTQQERNGEMRLAGRLAAVVERDRRDPEVGASVLEGAPT